jgi:CTP synthase (UTP-ammonia lyase)
MPPSQVRWAYERVRARSDGAGAEAIELREHPFFLATAFQPQVGSGESGQVHPLISDSSRRQALTASPRFSRLISAHMG